MIPIRNLLALASMISAVVGFQSLSYGQTLPLKQVIAAPNTKTSILLTWTAPDSSANVVVKRAVGLGAFATIATLPGTVKQYVDGGLLSGQNYRYQIYRSQPNNTDSLPAELQQRPYSGPITITKGGVYQGNWESTNPNVKAVHVVTAEPVTITKSYVRSASDGISSLGSSDARIIVQDTVGIALNPNVFGQTKGCFVDVGHFVSIVMENNLASGWACGLRALNYEPAEINNRSNQKVYARFNRIRNVDARRSNGMGGYQIIQEANGTAFGLNSVRKVNGRIQWNEIINTPYASKTEDAISGFESGGTATNPLVISNNLIWGLYHGDPGAQVGYSGTGINLGDCPSNHPDCGYAQANNNVVLNFSNSGMGIAGGHHHKMFANRVISAQKAPNGMIIGSTWRVGYGFWNYYNNPNWRENYLFGNYSLVVNRDGRIADNYTPSETANSVYDNIVDGTVGLPPVNPVSSQTEHAEHQKWLRLALANNVKLGARRCKPQNGIIVCD